MTKNNGNENKNGKKQGFSFSSLINDNRFLMIISILIAFGLWIWISIEKSPEVETVITEVPVQINLANSIPEQLDLKIFGKTDFTVDVTVTGKKYVLSNLTKDDISVEANVNYVDSPGNKTLQLRVTPKNNSDEFTISSMSATYIEVYFDNYKELELPLTPEINSSLKQIVREDCIMGDTVLSKGTVIVKGPATEINRITSVKAVAAVDEMLIKTTTFDPVIELVTNDGTKLEYSSVDYGEGDITMTVPVLKEVVLPTAVEFKNAPSYFAGSPLSYTVSPSSVRAAVPVEAIDTIKNFVVDTIDFSDITNSYNTFNIAAANGNSYKLLDQSVKSFKVRINASDYSSKTVTLPPSSVVLKNSRNDFTVKLDSVKNVAVTIVGPESALNALNASDITVEVDTSDKTITADTKTLPAKVVIKGTENCWAVGKYDVKITAAPIH